MTPVERTPSRSASRTDVSKSVAGLQDRILNLERRNRALLYKIQKVEREKADLSIREREKIQQLVVEFEGVRSELDQVSLGCLKDA